MSIALIILAFSAVMCMDNAIHNNRAANSWIVVVIACIAGAVCLEVLR